MIKIYGDAPSEIGQWISSYEDDNPSLLGCSSSTFFNQDYVCLKGLTGDLLGLTTAVGEKKKWVTRGEGVNSWIKIQFTARMDVYVFQMIQRFNTDERNKKINVEYEGGS